MTPFTTQYTTLLLELEKFDCHVQNNRKTNDHDDVLQDTCHRPVQFGGRGGLDNLEETAQAA